MTDEGSHTTTLDSPDADEQDAMRENPAYLEKVNIDRKQAEYQHEYYTLQTQLHQAEEKLQTMIMLRKRNEEDLQERITYLERRNDENTSKLQEQITNLKRVTEQEKRELEKREQEIAHRERECERVEELFKGGNDVNGLILDLMGRLKKKDEDIHLKDSEILSLKMQSNGADNEKQKQSPPILRRRSANEITSIHKVLKPQISLPALPKPPRTASRSLDMKALEGGMYYHPILATTEEVQKQQPLLPTTEVQKQQPLPFSMAWEETGQLKLKYSIVSGHSVYSENKDLLYFSSSTSQEILACSLKNKKWYRLPACPHQFYSLVVVDDYLTAVGGMTREYLTSFPQEGKEERKSSNPTTKIKNTFTNRLVSFIESQESIDDEAWVDIFPSMPTKRANVAATA